MGANSSKPFIRDANELDEAYDYIIVGSGPAGCVLANRLSQDRDVSVLLVEAGGSHDDDPWSKIPGRWGRMLRSSADWNYDTTPQPQLGDRKLYWPRGKVLGGCSSMNAMVYQHASPDDLNEWAAKGAVGWDAESLAPYYRKAEKYTSTEYHVEQDPSLRSRLGLWHTRHTRRHPMTDRYIQSCVSAGIPHAPDLNTPTGGLGVSHMVVNIDNKGERSSAATAYLTPDVRSRPNLTIAVHTRCNRVLVDKRGGKGTSAESFDDLSKTPVASTPAKESVSDLDASSATTASPASSMLKCTGVELQSEDSKTKKTIKARREVLLCSGAIGTPQILMCSGIGPEKDLVAAGIEVKIRSEHVGRHLSDHLCNFMCFRAKDSDDYLADTIHSLPATVQYWLFKKGPLSYGSGMAAAFLRLDKTEALWSSPISQLTGPVADTTSGPRAADMELVGVPRTYYKHDGERPPDHGKSYTVEAIHLRPASKGTVTVKSGNVWDDAIIEPNYFAETIDLDALIRATRLVLKVVRSGPLAEHLIFRDAKDEKPSSDNMRDIYWLADQDPDSLTDDQIAQWLRVNVETLHHPCSTARIGTSIDDGVVDSKLRVFGVDSLRVLDASIFPTQISAHTTATVIAVGEKAADLILAESSCA